MSTGGKQTQSAEICVKQSKQPRLSSYFVISSIDHCAPAIPTAGAGASSSALPGEEREREPRQKNKEKFQLSKELQKYRRETSSALDLEVEIHQSCQLRNWPPVHRMLLSPEIVFLYTRAFGNLHRENYIASDFFMLYACACDKLHWCVGEKLLEADPICAYSIFS